MALNFPIRSANDDLLAKADIEADIVQRLKIPEILVDISKADEGRVAATGHAASACRRIGGRIGG